PGGRSCLVRGLAPGERMDTYRSNQRRSTGARWFGSQLVSGNTLRFGANRSPPQGVVIGLARSAIFTSIRLAWETLNYEWDTRFLAYDANVQDVFLSSIGIANRGSFVLIAEIAVVAVARS